MPRQPDSESKAQHYDVIRISGLLVGKFTKCFLSDTHGMTYLYGVPVGSFHIVDCGDDSRELHYRRWPIVDELRRVPDTASYGGVGRFRIPGGRRLTFCMFALTPNADAGDQNGRPRSVKVE